MGKITIINSQKPVLPKRLKVAAYARVSSETDRMANSLSAQISYYSEMIQKNPKWEYAGVYSDSFISGTKIKNRKDFNKMIEDCDKGLIDIILCKSISRFARNTVDLLETVRHLKDINVEVQFEKENINSMSADGEFMLTILASFAQEESRSISENVKWSVKKHFEAGIPFGRKEVIGYDWVGDKLEIVPEEADVIKWMYDRYISGDSTIEIANSLNLKGIKTRRGKQWHDSSVMNVLTNITYTGNMILQKEYRVDPLSKKVRKNKGELDKYWIENSHEPIINMELFEQVQAERERRRILGPIANKALNTTFFSGKLKCPFCKVSYVHFCRSDSGKEYWYCATKKRKGSRCPVKGGIRHENLLRCCIEVLGIEQFDEKIYLEKIDIIQVIAQNVLEFHMKDGKIIVRECPNTGKKDFYSKEENRKKMSQWCLNGQAGNIPGGNCFTKKIKCLKCECNYRREKGRQIRWKCPKHLNECIGIREDVLHTMISNILSLPEFNAAEFSKQIDHINVDEGVLEFIFKDGHKISEKYVKPKFTKKKTKQEKSNDEKNN